MHDCTALYMYLLTVVSSNEISSVNFLQMFVPQQLQKGTPLSISLPAIILIMIMSQLQGRILTVIIAKLPLAATPLKKQ